MFKIFHGYNLVEIYHNWKRSHKTEGKDLSRAIRLIVAIVTALVVWCLPVENWIDGMTIPPPHSNRRKQYDDTFPRGGKVARRAGRGMRAVT